MNRLETRRGRSASVVTPAADFNPSKPCGPFADAEEASDRLLAAMHTEGGCWGEPMLHRWARSEGVPENAAVPLVTILVSENYVTLTHGTSPRWKAKRPS